MVDYKAIFKRKENQNWVKCSLAIQIARLGLIEFCKYEIGKFHIGITKTLPVGKPCTTCRLQDVIPYSKSGHKCRSGHCTCISKPCKLRVCDTMKTKIENEHMFNQISWKNTDISGWFTSPWEVAKCYFPTDGYRNKKTAEETDFNGLISLMMNCKIFERLSSLQHFQIAWEKVSMNHTTESKTLLLILVSIIYILDRQSVVFQFTILSIL